MSTSQKYEKEISFYDYFIPLTTKKAIIFLITIGFFLFFSGLFNTFVADDSPEITQNPTIQSIQNLPQFFSGGLFYMGAGQKLGGNFYRPLQSVYFSLIYSFFGPNYVIFHFFQLVFYLANVCIIFLFLNRFFNQQLAFISSLIFLVHPMNNESAYYISATQEVLFLFFGLLSLLVIEKYHSRKALIIASILLFCSLLSKETGILFFIIIPLYIFLYQKKNLFKFISYESVSFVIYALLRFNALGITPAVTKNAPIQELNIGERLINVPEIFLFYIKTFFYPKDLASVYQWTYRQIDFQHFYLPLMIDVAFLAPLIFLGILFRNVSRKLFISYIFFFAWFLIGIFIHLQIIPLDQTVTDQWFYFPMIGLLGMLGVIVEQFNIKIKKIFILSLIIIIISLLSVRTFIRGFDWRDDFTLASHDITVSKEAFPLEHQLSRIYIDRGEYQFAEVHAKRSISIFPDVFNNTDLGNAYFSLGKYTEAKTAYLQALKYGDNYATYDNLAALYINYGDPKEGIRLIKKTLTQKYPVDARLWLYLAVLEYRVGNVDESKTAIQYAYQYNPGLSEIQPIYSTIINNLPLHYKIGRFSI